MSNIMDLAEWLLGKLQDVIEEGMGDGYRFLFAPFFSVVIFLTAYRLVPAQGIWKWAAVFEPIVIYMLSVALSVLTIRFCPKWMERLLLKTGAYKKEEGRYYLKDNMKLKRDCFQFFDIFFIVYLAVYLATVFLLCAVDLPNVVSGFFQQGAWSKTAEGIVLWGALKSRYLNGITLQEEKEKSQGGVAAPVSSWDFLQTLSLKLGKSKGLFLRVISAEHGIQKEEETISHSYKEMFSMLIEEKSIFVSNAFYHDWERAFFIPVHRFLLNDRKVVILAGADMDCRNMIRWAERELENMIGISHSWSVKLWESGIKNWDITVVPYENILHFSRERNFEKKAKGFFVVVLEPSRILTEIGLRLELMADGFRHMEMEPVYCFADREIAGLPDMLSHVFRTKLYSTDADERTCGDVSYYGIDDGDRTGTWEKSAIVAEELVKAGEEFACVSAGGTVPLADIWNFMGGKGSLLPAGSLWELEKRKRANIIIYDENRDFYGTCRMMAFRGKRFSRIFVLSKDYALRDYMWQNFREQEGMREDVPIYYAAYEDTERNRLLKLLHYGMDHVISTKFLEELFSDKDISDIKKDGLKKMAKKYLTPSIDSNLIFDCGAGNFILSEECRKNDWWWLREVYLMDEEMKAKELGCRMLGQIFQWYLPGQYIMVHGCCYKIKEFYNQKNKDVMILRRSGSFGRPPSYQQKRIYRTGGTQRVYKTEIKAGMSLEWRMGSFQVETRELVWKEACGQGGMQEGRAEEGGRTRVYVRDRDYRNKKMLYLTWMEASSVMQREEWEMYEGLAAVFAELAITVFPHHYPYLAFLPVHPMKKNGPENILYQLEWEAGPDRGILILEDSMEDIGVLEAFGQHFQRIMDLSRRYCQWEKRRSEIREDCGEHDSESRYRTEAARQARTLWGDQVSEENVRKLAADEAAAGARDEKTEAEKGEVYMSDVPGCFACGEEVSGFRLPVWIHKYCGSCKVRENYLTDYEKSLERILDWLADIGIVFGIKPRACFGWWEFSLGLHPPVKAAYVPVLGKYSEKLVCRRHMKKECIDIHMVYGCVELWACRNFRLFSRHMSRRKARKTVRAFAHWFQVQYLYLAESGEEAEKFRRRLSDKEKRGLEELEKGCPYVKEKCLEERNVKFLHENNPVRKLYRQTAV